MPDTIVRCTQHNGKEDILPVRFVGENANFRLETERIEHRMSAEIGPRLLDLLEIAAAVFCADTHFRRGTLDQSREGRSWRRSFDFEFAVRDQTFWNQHEVMQAIRETVEFMTGDKVECSFVAAEFSPSLQSYFRFAEAATEQSNIDDVMLFSGGLDSLAGTLETLENTNRRIALVTHFSAQKTTRRQTELVARLRTDYRDRFIWIPVYVHRRRSRGKESTQRSRSLLFAALGAVVARMVGADRLQFFENGIVSQNLPLAPPIVGTLATRTTHPKTLKLLSDFLSEVCGRPFDVTNSFEWKTKTEVVRSVAEAGKKNLISQTVSCNHTFKRSATKRHCGSCSQCLDRRFAVLANDLGAWDPDEDYATDVLYGGRNNDQERALAIEWVRHACRLVEMSKDAFFEKFMSELLRVGSAAKNRQTALDNAYDMHRRHGQAVTGVLESYLSSHDAENDDGSIASAFQGCSASNLLVKTPTMTDPKNARPSKTRDKKVSDDVLEVVCRDASRFDVLRLQDFSGPRARILNCLLELLIEDRRQGLPIREFRGLTGRELADRLTADEDNIRQDITRIRADLKSSWTAIHGVEPARPLLIQTLPRRGYRLDPTVHVILPEGQA